MPYDAFVVDGSQLKVTIAASPTLIPGVMNLSFSGAQKTEIEHTAISDTAKKYKGGKPDYGNCTFDIAWDPADAAHQYLLTQFNSAGSTDAWTLTCSDTGAASVTFSGSLMEWNMSFEKDNVAKVGCRVKLSGGLTVTP